MPYEWDEAKRSDTLAQRGIDFASRDFFEWNTAVHSRSDRHGEIRWASLGYIGRRLHHVVWTQRGENIRIISLRKARSTEVRAYAQA